MEGMPDLLQEVGKSADLDQMLEGVVVVVKKKKEKMDAGRMQDLEAELEEVGVAAILV